MKILMCELTRWGVGRGAMMVVVDGWCDGFGWTENPTKAKKT
jgi:hypothetical protein